MKTEDSILDELASHVGNVAAQDFRHAVEHGSKLESPIERVMFNALLAYPIENICLFYSGRLWEPEILLAHNWSGTTDYVGSINCQVPIGKYRTDFYLQAFEIDNWVQPQEPTRIKDRWLEMVIECDGHDYHERTKEQARADKQRDRWFQMRGIPVLRFAGSEIWANPLGCAEQVEEAFFAAWRRYKGRGQ